MRTRSIQRQRRCMLGTHCSWRSQLAETWAVLQWLGSDLQHLLGRNNWWCEGQLKSKVQSEKKKQLHLVHSRKCGRKGRNQICFKLEIIKVGFLDSSYSLHMCSFNTFISRVMRLAFLFFDKIEKIDRSEAMRMFPLALNTLCRSQPDI